MPPNKTSATWLQRLYRRMTGMPVIGPLLALPLSLYRLPAMRRQLQHHLTDSLQQLHQHSAALDRQQQQLHQHGTALDRQQQKLHQYGTALDRQQQQLQEDASRAVPAEIYRYLQDQFRGSRDELEKRLLTYVPLFQNLPPYPWDVPLVDLGSGRGEWLDLLARNAVPARGVDSNIEMINHCRQQRLDVVASGALEYLKGFSDNVVPAITSFHLVEHLTPPILVELLRECFRVLRPGGLLLFETPNPENYQVSSYYFHLDPTHLRPLPPPLSTHLVHALGFDRIRVIRAAAADTSQLFADPRLNDLFCVSMDYAVAAYKPELSADAGN